MEQSQKQTKFQFLTGDLCLDGRQLGTLNVQVLDLCLNSFHFPSKKNYLIRKWKFRTQLPLFKHIRVLLYLVKMTMPVTGRNKS